MNTNNEPKSSAEQKLMDDIKGPNPAAALRAALLANLEQLLKTRAARSNLKLGAPQKVGLVIVTENDASMAMEREALDGLAPGVYGLQIVPLLTSDK